MLMVGTLIVGIFPLAESGDLPSAVLSDQLTSHFGTPKVWMLIGGLLVASLNVAEFTTGYTRATVRVKIKLRQRWTSLRRERSAPVANCTFDQLQGSDPGVPS